MKIAEALAPRADLQRRLEQLKQRLVKNARIQEGDKPEEDPVELQAELERSAQELIVIIQRINRTNAAARLGDRTMADALAERDVLKIRYNAYRELAAAASTTQGYSFLDRLVAACGASRLDRLFGDVLQTPKRQPLARDVVNPE